MKIPQHVFSKSEVCYNQNKLYRFIKIFKHLTKTKCASSILMTFRIEIDDDDDEEV